MEDLCIKIIDASGKTLAESSGSDEIHLVYSDVYKAGDRICFEITKRDAYYWLQLDDALGKSLVYLKGNYEYPVPFELMRENISPKAFSGELHLLSIKKARPFEYEQYRNLAYNINDKHGETNCYPHASANVETRGEAVFAAMNAIDGITVSHDHGKWPFSSWGINRREDAEIKLEFGHNIKTDRIIIYTRADYPHDNWWKQVTVEFSDGSSMELPLIKTGKAQEFCFEAKNVEWLKMKNLIKSDEESPFPALTQLEVYGTSK